MGLRMLLAAVLLCVAAASGLFYLTARPTTLRVGVCADDPGSVRLMQVADGAFRERKKPIRLKTVVYPTGQEAASALGAGKIDLAALRSDSATNISAEAVLVLRRDALIIVARDVPADSDISAIASMRLAIVPFGPVDAMGRLNNLLDYYGISRSSHAAEVLQPARLGEALADKKFDAYAILGPVTTPAVAAAVRRIRDSFDGQGGIVSIVDAEALAQRVGDVEPAQLATGIFQGSPPFPAGKKETVAMPVRLLASSELDDAAAYGLIQQFLSIRSAVRRAAPGYELYETPDPDESPVLVHPGARAFRDGDAVGFFDRYGDFLYLGLFVAGGLASVATAIAARVTVRRRRQLMGVLHDLQALGHEVAEAASFTAVEAAEAAVDQIMASVFARAARCELSSDDLAAINLAFDWWRGQVEDVRRRLAL